MFLWKQTSPLCTAVAVVTIALFTLALKPVSNQFTFKLYWPNHIHYVVYRKQLPKRISGVYTAAL